MKKQAILFSALVLGSALVAAPMVGFSAPGVHAHAAIGQPAPSWTLTDIKGASHSLSDYAGKYVVLEWTNPQCPYVKKHYRTGNMQATQAYAVSHGAIWLAINSSSKGNEGYESPDQAQALNKQIKFKGTAELIDADGAVGHEYNAKTTPDMMIINPKGVLIYSGGIDDKPTTEDEDVKTAHNYVKAALKEAMAGQPVTTSVSQPYGCSVKYAH